MDPFPVIVRKDDFLLTRTSHLLFVVLGRFLDETVVHPLFPTLLICDVRKIDKLRVVVKHEEVSLVAPTCRASPSSTVIDISGPAASELGMHASCSSVLSSAATLILLFYSCVMQRCAGWCWAGAGITAAGDCSK